MDYFYLIGIIYICGFGYRIYLSEYIVIIKRIGNFLVLAHPNI